MKQQDFGAIAELTAKLKSRDKAGLLELARKGQEIRKPTDTLKGPYVLDFLDLPDGETLHESDLEVAIIRQAYDDEHFYVGAHHSQRPSPLGRRPAVAEGEGTARSIASDDIDQFRRVGTAHHNNLLAEQQRHSTSGLC